MSPTFNKDTAIMNVGSEWIVDAEGCSADLLARAEILGQLCEQIVKDLELQVIGRPAWHKFPGPGGVTGLYLLTESHLACHTYPETGIATFNLYCCRPRPDWPWHERLARALGASSVSVRKVTRGRADQTPHPMNNYRVASEPEVR